MADVKVALQEIKEDSESGTAAAVRPRNRRRLLIAAVAGTLILIIGDCGAVVLRLRHDTETPLFGSCHYGLPGHEQWPTFSPDGSQVAFEWDGETATTLTSTSKWWVRPRFDGSPAIPQATVRRVGHLMAGRSHTFKKRFGEYGRPNHLCLRLAGLI